MRWWHQLNRGETYKIISFFSTLKVNVTFNELVWPRLRHQHSAGNDNLVRRFCALVLGMRSWELDCHKERLYCDVRTRILRSLSNMAARLHQVFHCSTITITYRTLVHVNNAFFPRCLNVSPCTNLRNIPVMTELWIYPYYTECKFQIQLNLA